MGTLLGFLTDEEESFLIDPNAEQRKKMSLLKTITKLIVFLYRDAFKGAEKIPKSIIKGHVKVNKFKPITLQNLQSTLKKQKLLLSVLDPDLMMEFRNKQILKCRSRQSQKQQKLTPPPSPNAKSSENTKNNS